MSLLKIIFITVVEWSGRHLTPAGRREKVETPEAKLMRLDFLPAKSKCLKPMERQNTSIDLT
jgi:hypothetical protein